MKKGNRWTMAGSPLALLIAGIVVCGAIAIAVENDGTAPWIQGATYITSGKCKMCHKKQYEYWSKTKHGLMKFPWETGEGEEPELLTGEAVYRYLIGYKAQDNTWAEKGTACEACHSPGSVHMKAKKEERKNTIVKAPNLKELSRQWSVCGRCHGQYTIGEQRFAASFHPGQDLFKIEGFVLAPAVEGMKLEQLNELKSSKHFEKGVTCIKCHRPHAEAPLEHLLRKPILELCAECHQDVAMGTHAPAAPEGATCASCHMPGGRHIFAKPPAG